MKPACRSRIALLVLCLVSLSPWTANVLATNNVPASPAPTFTISMDRALWEKWGFQYPVTYVFRVSAISPDARAERRDGPSDAWKPLAGKTPDDFFNGIECVRWDRQRGRAYVSVGFGAGSTIELRLTGVGSAALESIAEYYDDRKAAFTLSNDNWGNRTTARPGARFQGEDNDASDKYQAALHVCRRFHLPVSIAINSRLGGDGAMWQRMREELARKDFSWEPAVHSRSHACSAAAYSVHGYRSEILGCRDDILTNLSDIPYGQYLFEYILPCGYYDDQVAATAAGEFLILRAYNGRDNPASTQYGDWDAQHRFYGKVGFETKSYDRVLQRRKPAARYYADDVAQLNSAFDAVYQQGGIFYAMWHSDRYQNSVIHDPRPGVDGESGSSLIQHFAHVANRRDVWYAANGWLYAYHLAAEKVQVAKREETATSPPASQSLLAPDQFVHIPGPNPVLVPGQPGAWDDGVIEAADALHDGPAYYFFYHATGQGKSYRLGVATARHALGPFKKHGDRPILDLGPPGSWDDRSVACAMVLKEGPNKYWMWYSGIGNSPKPAKKWSIGLASATHPLGPWKKYDKNPILEDFGYVGGVVRAEGKYHLYTAHPIGSTGPDYSPMALATADVPTGPWTRWPDNPVLKEGVQGQWDHGGFSEAEVFCANGTFHMFYGGAEIHPERIRTRESIGYAFSADGRHFQKYANNPVVPRQSNPNAAAFAEIHAIHEPPFIYLYHTLRYLEPRTPDHKKRFPAVEDLGIQVLVTARPFRLDVPLICRESLGPRESVPLLDSPPLGLRGVETAGLTIGCTCGPKATRPLRISLLASDDGLRFDADPRPVEVCLTPGKTTQQSVSVRIRRPFVKVLVENQDPAESISRLTIAATLGG